MKKIIYCLLTTILFASCKESVKTEENLSTAEVTAMSVVEEASPAAVENADKNIDAGNSVFQKIIKNADIRFETEDLNATASRIKAAVRKHGAQLQHDSQGKDGYSLNRHITIRITSQQFEAFVDDISKGVAYFERKEISATDVTEEYIDVEARIKAKKVLEARYLELIKKAGKVSEILEIEKELATIREEIETAEGQLRYMQNRIALSTVNIEFYKKTASEDGATVSYGSKIGNALASGWNALSSFFIGLLYIWPFILIFVIAYILIRKRLRKRNKNYDQDNII